MTQGDLLILALENVGSQRVHSKDDSDGLDIDHMGEALGPVHFLQAKGGVMPPSSRRSHAESLKNTSDSGGNSGSPPSSASP